MGSADSHKVWRENELDTLALDPKFRFPVAEKVAKVNVKQLTRPSREREGRRQLVGAHNVRKVAAWAK